MPVYEYVCTSCGRRIDVRHSIAENGPTTCEVCGGRMRKALSTPAIHFKGSGWAKKDAQSAARGADRKAAGDGASDSSSVAAGAEASSSGAEGSSAAGEGSSSAAEGSSPGAAASKGTTKTDSHPAPGGSGPSTPARSTARSPGRPTGKKSSD